MFISRAPPRSALNSVEVVSPIIARKDLAGLLVHLRRQANVETGATKQVLHCSITFANARDAKLLKPIKTHIGPLHCP